MTDRVAINVLYQHPNDPAAFEKYYEDVHIPLVRRHASAIGIQSVDLVKFERSADGSAPTFYRMGTLWFDSPAALDRGMASSEFKTLVDDLKNFATGGVVVMISRKMS